MVYKKYINKNSQTKGEKKMGYFRDERGSVVGESGFGYYGNQYGSCEGKMYSDGTLVGSDGRIAGSVGSDGHVYDRYGYDTGYTYGD